MPLQPKSQPRKKLARVIRQLTNLRGNWKIKNLKEGMHAIERGCH